MHRIFPAPMVRDMGTRLFDNEEHAAQVVETYLEENNIEYELVIEEYTVILKKRIYKDKAGRALARVDMV